MPCSYGKAIIRHLLPPNETVIGPAEGADMALTFRNVHNWIMAGLEAEYFEAFYEALKPGGILGAAGFEFVESSEINANPKDTKDYPQGVWTLPPDLRLRNVDREIYLAIGESDRMTLKFRKPE
jgi:predicted methyltransferase